MAGSNKGKPSRLGGIASAVLAVTTAFGPACSPDKASADPIADVGRSGVQDLLASPQGDGVSVQIEAMESSQNGNLDHDEEVYGNILCHHPSLEGHAVDDFRVGSGPSENLYSLIDNEMNGGLSPDQLEELSALSNIDYEERTPEQAVKLLTLQLFNQGNLSFQQAGDLAALTKIDYKDRTPEDSAKLKDLRKMNRDANETM